MSLLSAFLELAKINKIDLKLKVNFESLESLESLEDFPEFILQNLLSSPQFSSFDLMKLRKTSKKMREKLSTPFFRNLILDKEYDEIEELINFLNENLTENLYNRANIFDERYLTLLNRDSIPIGIGHLTSLEELEIGNSDLETLPNSLENLDNLKLLNVNSAKLEKLPKLGKNIEAIYLNTNKLTELPEDIGDYSKLEELIVANNELKSLPESIGNLKLKIFDFSGNLIKELPTNLLKLPKLRVFIYDYNCFGKPFSSLPKSTQNILKKQDPDAEYNFSQGFIHERQGC